MEALKFDLEIPFWCAFADFSSINIKLTYPCPPITTIFGLIQNSLGKLSLHCIHDNNVHKKLKKQYISDFSNLKFSIIIKNSGELIEDYLNIHKGNRKDKYENELEKELTNLIKDHPFKEEIKKEIKTICKFSFFINLNSNSDENVIELENKIRGYDENLIRFIVDYWNNPAINFNYCKTWLNTQINKQRLINPYFSIYIISEDQRGEFSLKNLKKSLMNPKRPLYLGESDDIVNILNISIVEINENTSSNISSILPGIYSNSELVKIPTNIKFDDTKNYFTLCSIPKGNLNESIECYECNGENFVFLD